MADKKNESGRSFVSNSAVNMPATVPMVIQASIPRSCICCAVYPVFWTVQVERDER